MRPHISISRFVCLSVCPSVCWSMTLSSVFRILRPFGLFMIFIVTPVYLNHPCNHHHHHHHHHQHHHHHHRRNHHHHHQPQHQDQLHHLHQQHYHHLYSLFNEDDDQEVDCMRQTALHYSLATSRSTEAIEALIRWAGKETQKLMGPIQNTLLHFLQKWNLVFILTHFSSNLVLSSFRRLEMFSSPQLLSSPTSWLSSPTHSWLPPPPPSWSSSSPRAGAEVNPRRLKDGWTPLFLATVFGHTAQVKFVYHYICFCICIWNCIQIVKVLTRHDICQNFYPTRVFGAKLLHKNT